MKLQQTCHPRSGGPLGKSPYCTEILDFRGFDSSIILSLWCGISCPKNQRTFSGNAESRSLSRDSLGREIGRSRTEIRRSPDKTITHEPVSDCPNLEAGSGFCGREAMSCPSL